MRKAGLFMALTGVEVEDDKTLSKTGKGVTVDQIKKTIQLLRFRDVCERSTCWYVNRFL